MYFSVKFRKTVIVIRLAAMLFLSLKVQMNVQMIPLKQFLLTRAVKVVHPSVMTHQRYKMPCGCISNKGSSDPVL